MRADRLLSFMILLQTRGRMTARQLAEELEVCERTIYRDFEALSSAGVPVYSETGPEGGYRLLESYRTNLTGLSEGEARALFMLNMPGPLAGLGLSQELKGAMLKLAAALPESRRLDEERVRQRFWIDSSYGKTAEEPVPQLSTIQQAIWEDRRLAITYNPIFDVQIERIVDPYGLAARSGVWYLVFSREGRVRARRVADLLEVHLCGDTFNRPVDFDLGSFWKSWCEEQEQSYHAYQVTVRASKRAVLKLVRRFGSSVSEQLKDAINTPDGYTTLTLSFRSIDDAREHLLPFGGSLEVLEPYTLRANLADIAGQIAQVYRQEPD